MIWHKRERKKERKKGKKKEKILYQLVCVLPILTANYSSFVNKIQKISFIIVEIFDGLCATFALFSLTKYSLS